MIHDTEEHVTHMVRFADGSAAVRRPLVRMGDCRLLHKVDDCAGTAGSFMAGHRRVLK